MGRSTLFWGSILVIIGGALLLDNLGLLGGISIWGIIWPFALIVIGVWIIWGSSFRRRQASEQVSVPLDGVRHARVKLQHGAGRLVVNSGVAEGMLLEGSFRGGIELRKTRQDEILNVRLNPDSFAWFPGVTLDWSVSLSHDARLVLEVETGASDTRLDLRELQLDKLSIKSGASATAVTLPANAGYTQVLIESGAASVEIRVPEEVAGRIYSRGGLSSIMVNRDRFSRLGDVYQSADYEDAANKVDLDIQMGVGSVAVR